MPKYGCKKVHYRADGAGVFISKMAKMAIGLWDKLTGVFEATYKTNVPGKGKTKLDGKFGKMTQHLHRIIDEGGSFDTAEELYELLRQHPLEHTEYHLLDLKRDQVNWICSIPAEVEATPFEREMYLLSNEVKEERGSAVKTVILGKNHSNHGAGKILHCLEPKGVSFNTIHTLLCSYYKMCAASHSLFYLQTALTKELLIETKVWYRLGKYESCIA